MKITANITISPTAAIGARSLVVTNADTQTGTLANGFTVNQGSTTIITLVNQVSAGDGTGNLFRSIAAPPANHSAGNLLVVICRNTTNLQSQAAPTDTAGNQFVGLTPAMVSTVGVIQMWYAKNIQGNANNVVTCNFPSSDAWLTISVLQYSGADPNNPLVSHASAGGSFAATSGVTPAVTASQIGGLVVVGATVGSTGMAFSPGSGFTLRDSKIGTFSGDEDMSITAPGAVIPSMLWGPTAQRWAMVAAAFKPAALTTSNTPAVSLSVASLTFGNQTEFITSPAQAVTLSNTGTGPLSITSILPSGDYGQSNNCGVSLIAGANCTINVTFTPTATGTRSGTLMLTDNASPTTQVVNLVGTGVAAAPSVTSATPNTAAQGQALNVVLAGSNFVTGATCNFGAGITVSSCIVNSATQITANITISPTAAIGARSIVVTNADTQTGTLANGFTVVTQGSTTIITLVNQVSAGDGTGNLFRSIAAPPANHSAGNLLVVICRNATNLQSQAAPTDTAGNQFVGLTPAMVSTVGVIQMWYAKNIQGNANNVVTCNFPSSDAWLTISVLQYSGADPNNPLDSQASAGGSIAATSGVTPAVTASQIGGLVVVGATVGSTGMTFSPGSGFTLRDSKIGTFSGDEDMSITAPGTVIPSMLWGPSSQRWAMAAAAFK